jgi:hypothetical protein
MIICHANSGQNKFGHFNFSVELVQALLKERGSEMIRDFQDHHSTEKHFAATC